MAGDDQDTAETSTRAFSHKTTPARVGDILARACDVLVRDGYAGFNLRKVAAEVGVRLATVQYHFKDRETLLSAAIGKVLDGWAVGYEALSGRTDLPPPVRLAMIQDLGLDYLEAPSTPALLVEFFAAAQHEPYIRRLIHSRYYSLRLMLADILREFRPDREAADYMAYATLMTSQIDGLMLFLQGDDPARPDPAALRRALRSQLTAFLDAFAGQPAPQAVPRARATGA